jgi:hypothetical protein
VPDASRQREAQPAVGGPDGLDVVVLLVDPDEPEVDEEVLFRVGAGPPEVEEVLPLEPLEPDEPELVTGTTVTGTLTCAPVVVLTRVTVRVEPPPEGLVTGNIATVEPASGARTDGSVTTSMLQVRLGPEDGTTG